MRIRSCIFGEILLKSRGFSPLAQGVVFILASLRKTLLLFVKARATGAARVSSVKGLVSSSEGLRPSSESLRPGARRTGLSGPEPESMRFGSGIQLPEASRPRGQRLIIRILA